MAYIFDGKTFANKKLELLSYQVSKLKKKGIKPKLVSILVGEDPASLLYLNLKKKAAKRVGADVEIIYLQNNTGTKELKKKIERFNKNNEVNGIMIQLPLPENFTKKDRDEIINTIDFKKDVDGLRENSPFLTPVVKAVLEALKEGISYFVPPPCKDSPLKVVVVGARGFEGSKIFKVLKEMGYDVQGADRNTFKLERETRRADVLISATGSPGIIRGDMVKAGAIVIDVGSPKGDVVTEEVLKKASFISPVPGGIGPVTISCLLENLVESSQNGTLI